MKFTYLLLAVLLVTSIHASAQQKRDTVHHAATGKKKMKMKEELHLTDKQAADLKASKKEYKAEKEKVQNDSKLTAAQKKEKMKALKAEKQKDLDATLTPEQREKAKQLKAEKKAKGKSKK
ncbi:MAG TPA: hypothetical protein VL307_00600 [Chitinophagaceae bacterium]|nr:hypothetical protein [Chitinophagaceae bacterium]